VLHRVQLSMRQAASIPLIRACFGGKCCPKA
jgi:hypothetical protein